MVTGYSSYDGWVIMRSLPGRAMDPKAPADHPMHPSQIAAPAATRPVDETPDTPPADETSAAAPEPPKKRRAPRKKTAPADPEKALADALEALGRGKGGQ